MPIDLAAQDRRAALAILALLCGRDGIHRQTILACGKRGLILFDGAGRPHVTPTGKAFLWRMRDALGEYV